MLKKLFVGVIAAGALSVPLAAIAGAAPDPATNPGTPGNLGVAPGQGIKTVAQDKPQGTGVGQAAKDAGYASPGDFINNSAPGQQP